MSAKRALVIAPWLPEGDRESGLRRVSDHVDLLLKRGWEVTFGCLHPRSDRDRYVRELELKGVETHAPLESLDELSHPDSFDIAILAFWYIAARFLPEIRMKSPSTRVVVDSIDLHFLREMRERLRSEPGGAPGQMPTSQATDLIGEMNVYAAADAVMTVSEKEAELIDDFTGQGGLSVAVPDSEELSSSPVGIRDRRGILLLGNYHHAPNRDAVSYLCDEIVPRIDEAVLAEHEISIVGTAADEYLDIDLPHVKTIGWVPSVMPYLNSARVSIVPLRYGAGTKRKVIQSLMVGTPTVTTSVGAEGLAIRNGREALIADDPAAFAAATERLLRRSLPWRRLSRRGRNQVLRSHGRLRFEKSFDRMLELVFGRPARPAAAHEELTALDDGIAREPDYARVVARVREAVEKELPEGANVLVASRGDDGLVTFDGRTGLHFPQDDRGRYAGYHPADGEAAIRELEGLHEQGATHLVLPSTAFWWLAYYGELHRHLAAAYPLVRSDEDMVVYDLSTGSPELVAGREVEPEVEITAELVDELRPKPLGAISRYRNGVGRRALVTGVYLAERPNTAEHVAGVLAASSEITVEQRWAAVGRPEEDGDLGAVTALAVGEPTPKYELLNRLLATEDLDAYDFVLTVDDDVILPDGFLDLFLAVQAGLGFDLAQPARTLNSYVDHPIVLQQKGVLARRTLFVEIGPVVSFGRAIRELVLPFDDTNPMGWGFDNVWPYLLREHGRIQGIIDAVPVDHSIRKPVANYRWADANADHKRYLDEHPHLPAEECFQVLEVIGINGEGRDP